MMAKSAATDARPLLLLVDDEEAIRQILRGLGQREGFDVVSCASGNDALDVLRRAFAFPDRSTGREAAPAGFGALAMIVRPPPVTAPATRAAWNCGDSPSTSEAR